MKFRVISDIHNEFYTDSRDYCNYELPVITGESEMCLIMAGDIGLLHSPRTYAGFIDIVSKRFMYVFWIEGNHEFYHGNIDKHSIRNTLEEWHNVHTKRLILPEEKIAILGCTLWTDFDKGNPLTLLEANQRMNDHCIIRKGIEYSKFKAEHAMALHHVQKKQLFKDIEQYKKDGYKVIVVTHHHPSFKGVSPDYIGDSLNGAYCSDLSEEIIRTEPDYWVCGHIHTRQDYMIHNTVVTSNPLGYPYERTGFDPFYNFNVSKNYGHAE